MLSLGLVFDRWQAQDDDKAELTVLRLGSESVIVFAI